MASLRFIDLFIARAKGLLRGASCFHVEDDVWCIRGRRTFYVHASLWEIQEAGLREANPWGS